MVVATRGQSCPHPKEHEERFARSVDSMQASGLGRALRPVGPSAGGWTDVGGGRRLRNFSSNDYLGLSRHPELLRRAAEWGERWGVGATASRLVCGNLACFEEVEAKVARLKGTEAALVLGAGFQANSTVLPALLDDRVLGGEPVVFSDELNHASIIHGCKAARVRAIRFRHGDLDHLADLVRHHDGAGGTRPRPLFIVSETVFSMDGDRADVGGLVFLAERHGAFLYLDDAHATGILGPGGGGLTAAWPGRIDLAMGTFSKAMGSFGAYLAGSARLREYLVHRCPGLLYSTALPPPVLGAIDAALDLLPSLEAQRRAVGRAAARVRAAFQAAGLDTGASDTHIVPVILGDPETVLSVARRLEEEESILSVPIRPPTVPEGSSRIRFAVTAAHTREDLDSLARAVPRVVARTGTTPRCRSRRAAGTGVGEGPP